MRLYLIAPLVGLLATACASAQAKGSSDKPSLGVPPPPPHVVELPAEPLEPVGEITSAPTGTSPSASRSSRPAAPKPQPGEAKPEAKGDNPPTAPPPTTPEPAPALPPPPSPQLRTPQTADTSAAEKTVRTTIDRAKNTLSTVDFGPLSNERKKAYNDAKLFLQQAEDALKEGNIVFAQAVATKAETLAHELAGRWPLGSRPVALALGPTTAAAKPRLGF
jgi:predicted component of type VI protein secretion system